MLRTFAIAAVAVFAATTAHAEEREVTIDGGKAPLHGALLTPAGGARTSVAVLIISGSGPTDRDSNSAIAAIRPGSLKMLADGLAAEGVVSLRFDKRGVAASIPAYPGEADLRFTTYVDDAVAWGRRLIAEPGVRCIVIAGHSEGSLIGMMVAQRIPVCGLVSIAGAGRPAGVVMQEQLSAQPEPDRTRMLGVLAELMAGHTVQTTAPTDALFRPSIQPYLMSWMPIDPASEVKKVKAPVLIIQGERDIQVAMADADALSKARPDAQRLILPQANHILKDARADRTGNIATYSDPLFP